MILEFGSTYLCDVETEEQAFAEMCRYLEVNGIHSAATTICIKKGEGYHYKQITFEKKYLSNHPILAVFRLHYNVEGHRREHKNFTIVDGDLSALCVPDRHKLQHRGRMLLTYNSSDSVEISGETAERVTSCLARYIQDLDARKAEGKFPMVFDREEVN